MGTATETVARPAPRRGQPPRQYQPEQAYQPEQPRQPERQYRPERQYQPEQAYQPTQRYQPERPHSPEQRYQPEQQWQPRDPGPGQQQPPTWEPGPGVAPGGRRSRWPMIAGVALAAVLLGAGAGVYVLVEHPFSHSGSPSANAANSTQLPASATGTGQSSPNGTATSTGTPAPSPSPTPTPSPSPSTTERQAATALAGLLSQSSSDRSAISAAYSDVSACGSSLPQDQQTFQNAATNRQNLIAKLANLSGAQALPAGMVSDLTAAWQASMQVDQDYARWAGDQRANGCTQQSSSDPAYTAAATPNQQATANKTSFVALWNPLAQQYGLATYTQGQL